MGLGQSTEKEVKPVMAPIKTTSIVNNKPKQNLNPIEMKIEKKAVKPVEEPRVGKNSAKPSLQDYRQDKNE